MSMGEQLTIVCFSRCVHIPDALISLRSQSFQRKMYVVHTGSWSIQSEETPHTEMCSNCNTSDEFSELLRLVQGDLPDSNK